MASRTRSLIVPAIIIAAAIIVIAALMFSGSGDSPETAASGEGATTEPEGVVGEVVEPTAPAKVDLERHEADDPLAIGEVDAPVTIVAFSDFQCPFCALWSAQTLPELLPYVESGDLRVEWRDLAIFGDDSLRAAHAAYAAGMQGAYPEFSGALFADGESRSPAELSDDALEALADDLGLDLEDFNTDRHGTEVEEAVQRNLIEGEENGVFSTPVFLVDGVPISGAQPTEKFIEAVDAGLD